MPILCAFFACNLFGWAALWTVAYAVLAVFGIVYLGEHYVVDALAGGLLSVVVFAAIHLPWPRALPSRPRAFANIPPLVAAALLVVAAEGVGLLTLRLERPFEITQAFADRELAGRTPLAHLYLGQLALRDGNLHRARQEFKRAVATLESPVQRHYAAALLARTGTEVDTQMPPRERLYVIP
jgi:hypothetical protein